MSDQQGTQDPQLILSQLLFGKQMTYCLSGVARLGVADHNLSRCCINARRG